MTTTTSRTRGPAAKASRKPVAGAVAHLSVGERVARGNTARAEVPRSSHALFEPSRERSDPVELLERQAKTRVPELVPIRYGRMLVSPFTFSRGAAAIMAEDLAPTPRSGLTVQCCGDTHLGNGDSFDRAMVEFSKAYADQNERDYQALATAVKSGSITAETSV